MSRCPTDGSCHHGRLVNVNNTSNLNCNLSRCSSDSMRHIGALFREVERVRSIVKSRENGGVQ